MFDSFKFTLYHHNNDYINTPHTTKTSLYTSLTLLLYGHIFKKITFSARRLKVVSSESAPAYRKDVPGVITAVIVKSSSPAIEGDQHLHSSQRPHCGRTDKMRVFPVHRLQLHPHLEMILLWRRRFLLRGSRKQRQRQKFILKDQSTYRLVRLLQSCSEGIIKWFFFIICY